MEPVSTSTNFFTVIAAFLEKGLDLTITMRKDGDKLTVAVRPNYDKGQKYFNTLSPIMLVHPVADLDNNFFETITTPMAEANGLVDHLNSFKGQVEAAKEQATTDSTKTGKSPASTKSSAGGGKGSVLKRQTNGSTPKAAKPARVVKPVKTQADKDAEKKAKQKVEADKLAGQAESRAKNGDYKYAIGLFDKALKIVRDEAYVKERSRLEQLLKNQDAEKKIKPFLIKAEDHLKMYRFPELAKALAEIFALSPDHVRANELKVEAEGKIGAENFGNFMPQPKKK